MTTPVRAWLAFATLCALCLAAPVFPWVASALPVRLLGVPTALWWNVAWVMASFTALLALHLAEEEA